ncbi:hypothetical protein LXL04_003430 [Taraxacum kok-saghyz]
MNKRRVKRGCEKFKVIIIQRRFDACNVREELLAEKKQMELGMEARNPSVRLSPSPSTITHLSLFAPAISGASISSVAPPQRSTSSLQTPSLFRPKSYPPASSSSSARHLLDEMLSTWLNQNPHYQQHHKIHDLIHMFLLLNKHPKFSVYCISFFGTNLANGLIFILIAVITSKNKDGLVDH